MVLQGQGTLGTLPLITEMIPGRDVRLMICTDIIYTHIVLLSDA